MQVDAGALRAELVRLRRGAGLSVEKLESSSHILEAFAGAPADEAAHHLLELLRHVLDGSIQSHALRVAYNVADKPLGSKLTIRRTTYAAEVERDPTTVENWENASIDLLVSALMAWGEPKDDQLSRAYALHAVVKDRQVIAVSAGRQDVARGLSNNAFKRAYRRSPGALGLPLLLYCWPTLSEDRNTLVLAAHFYGEQPTRVLAWQAADIISLTMPTGLHDVQEVQATDHTGYIAEFRNPRPGNYYALMWPG